jgi:hypothetical protein
VDVFREAPGTEVITVDGFDAIIDWTPDEISGTALTFLPSGNTATCPSSEHLAQLAA